MSNAGWYPDPGGQPGMYRYWTGTSWSAAITPNPQQAPPSQGFGQPSSSPTQPIVPQRPPAWQQAPAKRSIGGFLGLGALALAIVVALWFAFQWFGGIAGSRGLPIPGSNPTESVCPKSKNTDLTPAAHPNDGRVHGGMLSYPQLGAPWSAPSIEDRVPFGRDVLTQIVTIEENYNNKGHNWVASVLVGELVAGDGFFTPKEGAEIVVKCLVGVFYDDAQVGREDKVNKATTVDGKEAWLVETHLSFDISGLKTKGELAIVLIVATSADASSIYYASIPDTAPQLVAPARQAMAQLKVGP